MSVVLFSSCATSYHTVNPVNMYFNNKTAADEVTVFYRHGILAEAGNRKQAKKEKNRKMKLVALRIVNNSANTLTLGSNLRLYSGDKEMALLPTL